MKNNEEELDELFITAIQLYEQHLHIVTPLPVVVVSTSYSHKPQDTCFAPPKSDNEIQQARERGIPTKTLTDTKCCMCIWRRCRVDTDTIIPSISTKNRVLADKVCIGSEEEKWRRLST